MVRHSRRNRKGGDKLDDIQMQLDNIQAELNSLKNKSEPEEVLEETVVEEPAVEEMVSKPIAKPWVDDKNLKFKDGDGGRVTLTFDRIMNLIQENINKGNTSKGWAKIKSDLQNAASTNEVQSIINQNKLFFKSNSVLGGTRKKRRHGKRSGTRRR